MNGSKIGATRTPFSFSFFNLLVTGPAKSCRKAVNYVQACPQQIKKKSPLRVNSLIVDHHKFLFLLFLFMRDGPLMSEFIREAGMAVYASMHGP